jgi:hypothetical protein
MEYMIAKIAEYFPILAEYKYIRARFLHQSKASEYRIIDSKVDDDYRRKAANLIAHAL